MKGVFAYVYGAGARSVKLSIDEVNGSGEFAYERSHYTFFKEDGSEFDHGKLVNC